MVFTGASHCEVWQKVRFTVPELANPAISGDTADQDGVTIRE